MTKEDRKFMAALAYVCWLGTDSQFTVWREDSERVKKDLIKLVESGE